MASFIEVPRTRSKATNDDMAKCRLFQCTKFISTARYCYNKSTAILILALTVSLYKFSANIARIFFKILRNVSKNQSQKSRHFGFS